MLKQSLVACLIGLAVALPACASAVEPATPTPPPSPPPPTDTPLPPPTATPLPAPTDTPAPPAEPVGRTPLVISEVMAGDFDFVELYNATPGALNLNGYRLVYRLGTTADDLPLFTFDADLTLPGYHHLLLAREGDDLDLRPDARFGQQMNIKTGGVGLYDPGGSLADAVAWGKAPPAFTEGTPAPEMPKESSLERLPGGADGNFTDSDNNAADFALTTVPNPQTAAAPPAPLLPQRLDVRLDAPPTVEPGQSFAYTLTAQNLTGRDLTGLTIELPLPAGLTVESADGGGTQTGDGVTWAVPALPAGETAVRNVTVAAPWTVTAFRIDNYRAAGPDLPRPAYGPAVFTEVAGGTIPIGVARALPPGTAVTIEGTATMYTGGYYAGGGNTKFYLQDETGGIQVQVFGADGPLPGVALGDRVRVSGVTELYRDSLEIIPQTLPDDVEFTGAEPPLAPARRAIAEATADPNRAGEYVAITGRATRIEEFTYSYELDLLDDAGDTLMLYVDKLTNLTTDTLNEGSLYTVAGVLEYYQGRWQLKPRVPADFQEVFPPELRLEISAPNTAQPGDSLEYTLTVFNHTAAPLTGVVISSPIPAELDEVFDGGAVDGDAVRWEIPTLPPNGGSAGVRFAVIVPATGEQVVNDGYRATAAEWPAPVSGPPFRTFIGNTVPVWAVQGPGFKSPYANSSLQTEGIVTALFNPAQIPGFFIQEAATDADPATSAGLFVWAEAGAEGVAPGDVVRVAGVVREVSGQTQLKLERVEVLAHGAPLPEAAPLDPPPSLEEANVYYEALEGMLVRVDGVAVSPISKYGETNLVLPKHQRERIFRGEGQPAGLLITVDDNSWTARYDDAANLPFSVVSGDLVAGVAGPLAYTFGQYKIEPLAPPTVIPGQFERVPSLPEVSAAGFSLAMYNVENFFDDKDPNPADPPRPNRRQYLRKAAKIANSIAAMGYPTLIAFAEVENIGVLERVAGQPQLADYNYRAVLVEGRDSRGIDVGYLVRGDRAEALNAELRLDDEGLFTRGPLVLQTRIATPNGDVTLYTLANHWVSLGAGFETTEPRREQQAQWNLNLAAEILAADPQARIAILGDLNTFLDAPSIQLLRNAGFVHVFDFLPPEERYTYIYQGESETLDHILVTPNLAELIAGVSVLHINADFPPAAPDDDSPRRTSDHDPVVVQFEMK